jgi:hypothetical protein
MGYFCQLAEMSVTHCQLAKNFYNLQSIRGGSANWQRVNGVLPIGRTSLAERGFGRVTQIRQEYSLSTFFGFFLVRSIYIVNIWNIKLVVFLLSIK